MQGCLGLQWWWRGQSLPDLPDAGTHGLPALVFYTAMYCTVSVLGYADQLLAPEEGFSRGVSSLQTKKSLLCCLPILGHYWCFVVIKEIHKKMQNKNPKKRGGGLTNERPQTDHGITGPMRGLGKNCMGRGPTRPTRHRGPSW